MDDRTRDITRDYDLLVCPLCLAQVTKLRHIETLPSGRKLHHINTSLYHPCAKNEARAFEGHDTVPLTWTGEVVTKTETYGCGPESPGSGDLRWLTFESPSTTPNRG